MGREENAPCPRDQPELEGFGTNPLWDLPPWENHTEGVLGSEVIDGGGYSRKMKGKGLTQEPVTLGTRGACSESLGERSESRDSLWTGTAAGASPREQERGATCCPAPGRLSDPERSPHLAAAGLCLLWAFPSADHPGEPGH